MVPLSMAEGTDAGGKAVGLARLLRIGVAVPDGWVVTLRADRLHRLGELSDGAIDALVSDRLLAEGQPADRRFAVRSSADTEDSAKASYAGLFRTELNVPRDDVPGAVRRVLASLDSPSALVYARRLRVRAPEAMAVLVQEQLDPFLSGVCFTAHPVTGAPSIVVEYARGLGDAVASGAKAVGSYVLPRRRSGGFADQQLAELDASTGGWLRAVALLAVDVEAQLGGPQDIEWAVDDRGLWLVQARPITTIGAPQTSQAAIRSDEDVE